MSVLTGMYARMGWIVSHPSLAAIAKLPATKIVGTKTSPCYKLCSGRIVALVIVSKIVISAS